MRKKLIAALVVAIAAAVPVVASATAHTNSERFSFINTSTSPTYSVIATGAFIDGGTARPPSKGVLVLHLSAGTITFQTKKAPAHITTTETATACLQTQTKHSGYTITGGTGAYKGITGSGRSDNIATFVEPVTNGKCADSLTAVQGLVTASGPVTLP